MKIIIKTIKDIKSFTISRSKWARNNINGPSCLLNDKGNMCCLGFYTKACGFNEEQLNDRYEPINLFDKLNNKNKAWLANYNQEILEVIDWKTKLISHDTNYYRRNNSNLAWKLMEANDNPALSEKEREMEIKDGFAKIGVKVRFVK